MNLLLACHIAPGYDAIALSEDGNRVHSMR